MIINDLEYIIKYPLKTNLGLSIVRDVLSSGYYRTWDYGISSDVLKSSVDVTGVYDDLKNLMLYLKSNREISVSFNQSENIFGSHIDYENKFFDCIATNIGTLYRRDNNFWGLSFDLSTSDFTIKSITADLDDLWYPAEYEAGLSYLGESTIQTMYGDVANFYDDTIPVHKIRLDLDLDLSAKVLKYFLVTVRGDGFELPSDWASLKPFAEEDYTHALLMNISFSKNSFNRYAIELDLQGYNNA